MSIWWKAVGIPVLTQSAMQPYKKRRYFNSAVQLYSMSLV